jgi:gas vesicle protein
MENSSKIIAAFLAGAAAGASLGLLLAPDKGEETRKRLRSSINEFGDKANEQYTKYKDQFIKDQFIKDQGKK